MKTSIYTANRPFTVIIPAAVYERHPERGETTALIETLITEDFKTRSRRKVATDNADRPGYDGEYVRVSVSARVDGDLAKGVKKMLKSAGIKPRLYVAELLTAYAANRKPVFTGEVA